MNLEVGMYVRTDKGNICKIIDYHNDITDYFYACYETDLKESLSKNYLIEENILKASHNIIDLIEVGDILKYVYDNKECVSKVLDRGSKMLLVTAHLEVSLGLVDIKSIVTKEIFSSISYEVSK